ncbi:16S rRNA (cytosine(967)-C(5))-methyltransferase RsmB [Pseudoflavonifractor sp. MSJ-37]|uniref:16S rRNA (cytosine(967)-C(5))-methyltransferase RsmB n=1 Tax=Pseudoflavonifractor sp. MSJ-37 TaxID=2841531 RepID=UPI001C119C09|nr:16S rRNA (cytosine(967)-C(5))-methyltransferase RsmB [Pseudoflavonifractor sp. MSJ-37]MBU5434786.1 16S rRNA (cytosine(967)-C(5))-methyltransferase RsmB [Pseudoflavonifractor sp. MSJ-37]
MRETAKTAREAALLSLTACERQGAWSDNYLKRTIREAGLDSRDGGLASKLCYGVQQEQMLLDWYLAQFSKLPLEKLEPKIRNCLRLGAYQILMLDRIPDAAAVDGSVSLARKHAKNPKAAGMVNAILRNLIRGREELAPPTDLATRYSHPAWLVKEFDLALKGRGTEALLAADNEAPPTMAQVNTVRYETGKVLNALRKAGVDAELHPWLPDCLLLSGTGDLERLDLFRDGAFYIQDAAARLAVMTAAPKAGQKVLDACAAPGGKTFAAAVLMEGQGEIWSCDIHPRKAGLIQTGAARLGFGTIVHTAVQDGRERREDWLERFDVVLADVPCSGLGIIRKKPDIRYKDPGPLSGLPPIQAAILENVSHYVAPGGVLLYSTCTLLRRENEDIVSDFLDGHLDFTAEPFQAAGPIGPVESGMLTLWPHIHGTDGFFLAKLRRRA